RSFRRDQERCRRGLRRGAGGAFARGAPRDGPRSSDNHRKSLRRRNLLLWTVGFQGCKGMNAVAKVNDDVTQVQVEKPLAPAPAELPAAAPRRAKRGSARLVLMLSVPLALVAVGG